MSVNVLQCLLIVLIWTCGNSIEATETGETEIPSKQGGNDLTNLYYKADPMLNLGLCNNCSKTCKAKSDTNNFAYSSSCNCADNRCVCKCNGVTLFDEVMKEAIGPEQHHPAEKVDSHKNAADSANYSFAVVFFSIVFGVLTY